MKKTILTLIVLIGLVTSMALWDTDKTNSNRLNPKINAKDSVANRMAHGTTGFTLKGEDSDSTLGKLVFKDGKLSLIKEDGAVVNITGDGMKIAQPGFDANTVDNINLVMTSDLNSFKIVEKGSIVMPSGSALNLNFGSSNQTLITQNEYTKKPIVLCFDEEGVLLTEALDIHTSTFDATYWKILTARTINFSFDLPNTFEVQISWKNASGSTLNFPAETIYYYILQETSIPT